MLLKYHVERLGVGETFISIKVVYFMIGMSFGCSYSLNQVEAFEFVQTPRYKRIIRAAIALVIILGL
jgi:hypothetical protein